VLSSSIERHLLCDARFACYSCFTNDSVFGDFDGRDYISESRDGHVMRR